MIKKSVFGKRDGGTTALWYVTQYRIFGLLVYQMEIEERIAARAPNFIH